MTDIVNNPAEYKFKFNSEDKIEIMDKYREEIIIKIISTPERKEGFDNALLSININPDDFNSIMEKMELVFLDSIVQQIGSELEQFRIFDHDVYFHSQIIRPDLINVLKAECIFNAANYINVFSRNLPIALLFNGGERTANSPIELFHLKVEKCFMRFPATVIDQQINEYVLLETIEIGKMPHHVDTHE